MRAPFIFSVGELFPILHGLSDASSLAFSLMTSSPPSLSVRGVTPQGFVPFCNGVYHLILELFSRALLWTEYFDPSPNSYVEAPVLTVVVCGAKAFMEVMKVK